MKLIFLDIDGVLNKIPEGGEICTPARTVNGILTQADPELVFRLNKIVDKTGAELVLSSSWRHMPDWQKAMRASGIIKPFLGRTDILTKIHGGHNGGNKEDGTYVRCRGRVIDAFLRTIPCERYAILDDCNDMLPLQRLNFFKTDPAEGLTEEIADWVVAHLTS